MTIAPDDLDEDFEEFRVKLSNQDGARMADRNGLGQIADDDPEPTVAVTGGSATEGDSATAPDTFTLTLSHISGRQVTTRYVTNELPPGPFAAQAPGDFIAVLALTPVTFEPGELQEQVSIDIVGDTVHEEIESFKLSFFNLANATFSANADDEIDAPGTIFDNDPAP